MHKFPEWTTICPLLVLVCFTSRFLIYKVHAAAPRQGLYYITSQALCQELFSALFRRLSAGSQPLASRELLYFTTSRSLCQDLFSKPSRFLSHRAPTRRPLVRRSINIPNPRPPVNTFFHFLRHFFLINFTQQDLLFSFRYDHYICARPPARLTF